MVPPDNLEESDEEDEEDGDDGSPDGASEAKTPERPCAHAEPASEKTATEESAGIQVSSVEASSEKTESKEEEVCDDDDPEMQPVYLRRLLPLFANVYQSTVFSSVRFVVSPLSMSI